MIVEASGLTKTYGTRRILDDVSFVAAPGTVTAVVGPNGAGKSTLFKLMTGIVGGRGQTTYGGVPWRELTVPRRSVGVYLGSSPFHAQIRLADHLRVLADVAGVTDRHIQDVVGRFGLGPSLRSRISALSLGTRQRVGLASAVLADPPVLMLDEPCNALDPGEARKVHAWIRELAVAGRTVIVATHHLERIQPYATHALVLSAGRAVASGAIAAVAHTAGIEPSLAAIYEVLV